MESNMISKYAILTHTTELREHISHELLDENSNNAEPVMRLTRVAGTLLKVFHTRAASAGPCTVQVLDFVNKVAHYENLYECPQKHMLKVSEDLWPYIIAIAEPERRLRFVQKGEWRRAIYMQPQDMVCVPGDMFGRRGERYDCIVRYIGPVEELYPVGYFFALELLHLNNGFSPQLGEVPFANKYLQCDPSLTIFTTADWISPLPNDTKKKFSPIDLLSDTLEKVRHTAVSCLSTTPSYPGATPHTHAASPPRQASKKQRTTAGSKKTQKATAQFYAASSTTTSDVDTPSAGATPVPAASPSMERRKAAESTTHTPALIMLESEDFNQKVEQYEKTLERQHIQPPTASGQPGVSTSNASSQTAMPAGILKHRSTVNITPSSMTSAAATSKPLTILSLGDRDIVVIDKADIQDATKNEGSVIVVNKQRSASAGSHARQQEVGLAELLGSDWPQAAGEAAVMLNKRTAGESIVVGGSAGGAVGGGGSSNSSVSSMSQRTSTIERQKSPNPLMHIANNSNSLNRKTLERKRGGGGSVGGITYDTSAISNHKMNNAPLPVEEEAGDFIGGSPLQEVPHSAGALGVGSMVEVSLPEAFEDIYGVIRWIGVPPGSKSVMVGVELEEDADNKQLLTTDGTFNGVMLFKCPEGRALFVLPSCCARDKRFLDVEHNAQGAAGHSSHVALNGSKMNGNAPAAASLDETQMFGHVECPPVPGAVAPLKIYNVDELDELCGKFKGIQGHHNSCYLDATLFAMFTFTSVFDSLLFRPPDAEDITHYLDVQQVLREEIVNPLRKNIFVRADRVMKLRKLLDKLSSVSGLTSEEKDPEEFLNSLLAQIMRVEPFLKLSSGQDAYYYQLFVEKDERLSFPSVQQLFEQSFHSSDIKLKEVPACLIIQMPRFGKDYKMYPRILPSQVLDVTDIIDDSPRQCTVCGKLAEYECRDCFGVLQGAGGLEGTAFCPKCLETVHMHAKRVNHHWKPLSVPQDFRIMAEHMSSVPRLYMELFAVVCIETSHYVAFVKASCGPDAPWCFFDSMADRKGEQNGYNIPEMLSVPDLPQWLSEDGARIVNETSTNDKMLPEHAKRLFCDAYMCMYQSTDVMMYR